MWICLRFGHSDSRSETRSAEFSFRSTITSRRTKQKRLVIACQAFQVVTKQRRPRPIIASTFLRAVETLLRLLVRANHWPETLWVACALRGIEGEQTLGAVSVNGSPNPRRPASR
jgi:hypothetical protein